MDLLVNLDVDDLERAIRFCGAVFDLEVGRRFGNSGAEMLGSSALICLLPKPAGTPASPATSRTRRFFRHWTPVHLEFVVEHIEPEVEKEATRGDP